jgi:hypothetical protein
MEDYPSQEVALRVQLQMAIEEERSARPRGALIQQVYNDFDGTGEAALMLSCIGLVQVR